MTVLFYALPALMLLAALWLGHYPGERLRLRLAGPRHLDGRLSATVPPPRHLRFARHRPPRGGALIGAALAGRAPPSPGAAAPAAATDGKREERIQMNARKMVPAALCALALLAPAAAGAHVTVQPNEAPEGAYTVLDVRVPNESDHSNTTKVAVQFPEGFGDVSYQSVPGWTVEVIHQKLKVPIQTDDGPVTEGVKEVIFSGGKLAPGQFQDFPLSVQIPGKAGEELTFKAVQTYEDEVVRWIGAPETEHPAPQVLVTPPKEPGQTASVAQTGGGGGGSAAAGASESGDGGGSSDKGLAIAALVVAVIALLVGGAAVVGSRRRVA